MTPLEAHWRISASLGHHWASDARPAALAYGNEILRYRERHLIDQLDYATEGVNHEELRDAYYAEIASLTIRDEFDECIERPDVPPANEGEALALSALPAGHIAGIAFKPGLPYVQCTGSGRLRWTCSEEGTLLEIHRPGGVVMSAWVPADAAPGAVLRAVRDIRARKAPVVLADRCEIVIHEDVAPHCATRCSHLVTSGTFQIGWLPSRRAANMPPKKVRSGPFNTARSRVLRGATEAAKQWLQIAQLIERVHGLTAGVTLPIEHQLALKVDALIDRAADIEYALTADTPISSDLAASLGLSEEP